MAIASISKLRVKKDPRFTDAQHIWHGLQCIIIFKVESPLHFEEFVNQSVEWYPIISITETWLKPHVTDAQLHITGYNIYRSDRCHRGRGGSCLYIHESYIVSENFKFDNGYCEVVACVKDSAKSIIFSVYRPGDTPPSEVFRHC